MGCSGLRQRVGNWLFMLLIFLFVADPTNSIFHLKTVVFALLFLYNIIFFKAEWGRLCYFAVCLVAILLPWLFALFRGEVIDTADAMAAITAVMPLLLLPWLYRYDVLSLSQLPVILTVLLVIMLYWMIFFVPRLEGVVYLFMCAHDHSIMLSRRVFLGFSMFGMYCKSTVAFLPVFALMLYKAFTPALRNARVMLAVFLFIHLFLISGTRSTMLLPTFLALVLLFVFYRNNRYCKYLLYPLTMVGIFAFGVLLVLLLTEVDEHSNMVKYAHIASYVELFRENPIYMILGQGPGTAFYSEGFQKMSLKTEWSYMELWRNYGVFALLILYIYLRPLLSLLRSAYKNDEALVIALTYIIYLVIAGTNPLLLSSTGMTVLLTVYSCAWRYRENKSLSVAS